MAVSATPSAATLTLQQLAGQRVIYSYSGLTPPASLLGAIRRGRVAGVIFFSQNISSRSQIRAVASELQAAAAHSPVKLPLLLMTDQEGGLVRRLPGAPIYSEKQIGGFSDSPYYARKAGRGAGLNLRSAGLNVNLAPVLDVYRSPGDFIDQYGRSYSNHARTVATLGGDFITKQQQTGVAATAKHFPGLGAAAQSQNTDARPVTLPVSLSAIRGVDELPYHSAIAAGVKLVMVSWARYPALDRAHPAGLSSTIVTGELRRRLHFRGVTISDALEAGGLRGFGGTSERSYLAAKAGIDLILCSSQNPAQGTAAATDLANALRTHHLSRSGFLAAANRVLALRRSLSR
jgi:beta-N-acetylhexosaminidase